MNIKIVSSAAALLIAGLTYVALTYKPLNAKYPIGSCLSDRQLKVKYKVLNVTADAYEIEVIDSGHYTMSPEYQKSSQLMYSKPAVETGAQYHPAFCEETQPET